MSYRYWAIIVLLGVGWGSSFFFNEILLRELGPFTTSLGRIAFGALGVLALDSVSARAGLGVVADAGHSGSVRAYPICASADDLPLWSAIHHIERGWHCERNDADHDCFDQPCLARG